MDGEGGGAELEKKGGDKANFKEEKVFVVHMCICGTQVFKALLCTSDSWNAQFLVHALLNIQLSQILQSIYLFTPLGY